MRKKFEDHCTKAMALTQILDHGLVGTFKRILQNVTDSRTVR